MPGTVDAGASEITGGGGLGGGGLGGGGLGGRGGGLQCNQKYRIRTSPVFMHALNAKHLLKVWKNVTPFW